MIGFCILILSNFIFIVVYDWVLWLGFVFVLYFFYLRIIFVLVISLNSVLKFYGFSFCPCFDRALEFCD